MIKGTSIASVIFVNELTFRSQQIVGQNFKFFTVFAAAGIIYLMMTSAVAHRAVRSSSGASTSRSSAPARRLDGVRAALRLTSAARRAKPAASRVITADDDVAGAQLRSRPTDARRTGSRRSPTASVERADGEQAFVVCRDVWKSYGGREVLRGIDLTVSARRGGDDHGTERLRQEHAAAPDQPSRARSTAARSRSTASMSATSKVDGMLRPIRDLARARADARIGMVFQHFNLFDHLTALENVTEAPIQRLWRGSRARPRARA